MFKIMLQEVHNRNLRDTDMVRYSYGVVTAYKSLFSTLDCPFVSSSCTSSPLASP